MGKAKLLLIEDDTILSKVINEELGEAGFDVLLSYDGEDGLELAKTENPDLIILDIVMPRKDGFEVLEELQQDDKLKEIPIIILSNLGHDDDIKKGTDLGATDYLIKSRWTIKEVVDKVEKCLKECKKT
jgi:DNA-binding response OmpR family regulator